MTTWSVLTFVALVAAVGFAAAWWRQRRQRREAEARAERRIDELRRQHTDRVHRLEEELERAEETGHLALAEDLLPVADALDRAVPPEGAEVTDDASADADVDESVAEGVAMARRKFRRALDDHDIERVSPERGDDFDPTRHEAIRAVDETAVASDCVVTCHRAGYVFDNRVLRAATVEVAVGDGESDDGSRPADEAAEDSVDESSEVGARSPGDAATNSGEPAPESAEQSEPTRQKETSDEPA